jgi:hypothetical protein
MAAIDRKPRLAASLYLVVIVAGIAGVVLRSGLFVRGDAEATAQHISVAETAFRFAFVSDLAGAIAYIPVTLLLYEIFRPAGKTLSAFAAILSFVGSAVGTVAAMYNFAPVVILKSAAQLPNLAPSELAYLYLRLNALGTNIALVFFGFYCISIGTLARKLPSGSILAIALQLGGLCYLISSFSYFLAPQLAAAISPYILLPSILAEVALTAWLFLKSTAIERLT